MPKLFQPKSPVRIFAFSIVASIAILLAVLIGIGPAALLTTFILAIIEITFSFDNAIINAKVLERVSGLWQTIFLTAGIVVAIFGMRIIFPIAIVSLTAHLGWGNVVNLALHHPQQYAHHLEQAHASIAAFGGVFLLLLGLQFFFDETRKVIWLKRLEQQLQRIHKWWGAIAIAGLFLVAVALLPTNSHGLKTLAAGSLGAATYLLIQFAVSALGHLQPGSRKVATKQVGLAAFTTLVYLEILDASFSFDGVIGAFAITSDVVLIAAGLGIGALWVRSLTVYMVRRGTLSQYRYLEHGAYYTILVLAILLLISVVINISDFIPGLAGIGIIGASVAASVQARKKDA